MHQHVLLMKICACFVCFLRILDKPIKHHRLKPIALRRPKLYTILAFLSAIGLSEWVHFNERILATFLPPYARLEFGLILNRICSQMSNFFSF